jgi:hypothetical protein
VRRPRFNSQPPCRRDVVSVPRNTGEFSAYMTEDCGEFRAHPEFRAVRRCISQLPREKGGPRHHGRCDPLRRAFGNATDRPQFVVAYFSMEVALENHIPTHSGGLGVLAGDMLRTAADQALPLVGVSLVSSPWLPLPAARRDRPAAACRAIEGTRLPARHAEYDAAGPAPEPLRERCHPQARRGLAHDVLGISDQLHHERCALADLDRAIVSRSVRSDDSGLAPRRVLAALCVVHPARRDPETTPRSDAPHAPWAKNSAVRAEDSRRCSRKKDDR